MTNYNAPIFYEQGTGSYGDASNLIFLEAPEANAEAYQDDDAMWEHVEKSSESWQMPDLIDVLRAARDGRPDVEALDRILSILDPGDSVAFEPEDTGLGAGYLDGARGDE